jgi:FMN phosphatase YigB (HAD superfamily)
MLPTIIFDLNRTLLNPDTNEKYPDSLPVLDFCQSKNYQLLLVAQAVNGRAELVKELFDGYFANTYFVASKSSRQFRDITKRHNIDLARSFVVGDRARKEVLFGHRAGFQTIWLCHDKFANEQPQQFEPTYTIKSLHEVNHIV